MSEYVGGAGSADQAVTLGDFTFYGWEVPEKVTWGGQQRMTVHKFVGGTRWIDVMGQDNADITWSSRFLSPDASARADQLDQLRKAGAQLDLVFAGRYYSVVISGFTANQEMLWHVPYTITLTPVSDNSFSAPAAATPLSAVNDDINAVMAAEPPPPVLPVGAPVAAVAVLAALTPAETAVAAVPAALAGMSVIAAGTAATTALAASVAAASTAVETAQTAADAQIATIAAAQVAASNLAGAASAAEAVNNMQTALAATYASATAVAMAGYVDRAAINIANA